VSENRVLLGRILGAHGLRGEVKILSFTADPLALGDYGALLDGDGRRKHEILGLRPGKDNVVIARLRDVSDRNAAEALRGIELYIDRSDLPPPEEDEFYYSDLIGMAVVDETGQAVGEVAGVHNFGAGDLLEVRFTGERETRFLPFTKEQVPSVDIRTRRVTLATIEIGAPDELES
jgi:16S rRNA processing protein RimM